MTTSKRFYKKLLDKYQHTSLFQVILSTILVCEGIRPAMLVESINSYSDEEKAFIYRIPEIFKKIKPLVFSTDSKHGRIFVFIKDSFVDKSIREDPTRKNNDRYVGEYLGFNCFDHDDYYNYQKTRIMVEMLEKVTNVQYIAEVCEKGKINIQTLQKNVKAKNDIINALLIPLGYESTYNVEIIAGCIERYNYLKNKDIEYVKLHLFEYIEDLYNLYIAGDDPNTTTYIDNSLTKYHFDNITTNNITKLTKIYKIACIDEKFESLYNDTDEKEVSSMLLQHDTEYWNGTRQLQDIGKI